MKAEHKAIIEKAQKEGRLPHEYAAELIVHDMVNATRAQMSRYETGWKRMTEKQQDAALADLQDAYEATALSIASMIASNGVDTVKMKLKDLKVSNGQLTGIVGADEDNFNALIAKVQDKSDVLVVLYEREFAQGMDAIQSDKDQPGLDLEGKQEKKPKAIKPKAETKAEKPIELPEGLISQAIEFVTKQQNTTIPGLQNQLKIDITKAKALHAELEKRGVLTAEDESGKRSLVKKADAAIPASTSEPKESLWADLPHDDEGNTVMSDLLIERATRKVEDDDKVSMGYLAVTFNLSDVVAVQLLERLEKEGVIAQGDDGAWAVQQPF